MYFPDLTPYEYARTRPQATVLNVGWLSAAHAFSSGTADERLVNALQRLVASPVNLRRGFHLCEFCPNLSMKMYPRPPGTSGNGEIRVAARNGVIYVAPVLVLHYVVAHGYLPPQEFIDAAIDRRST